MPIKLTSVFVDDQEKALRFYTGVPGFIKKTEIPMGDAKWLIVISPDHPNDVELLLEPNSNPAAGTYQKATFQQGIPATAFAVDDIQQEYKRLEKMGVSFKTKPTATGAVTIAVFDDTCGNLIQIYQNSFPNVFPGYHAQQSFANSARYGYAKPALNLAS